tara:strand:- start:27 stop:248 length:222 start_codon:yes stop_codon:yes gene_type:complete
MKITIKPYKEMHQNQSKSLIINTKSRFTFINVYLNEMKIWRKLFEGLTVYGRFTPTLGKLKETLWVIDKECVH